MNGARELCQKRRHSLNHSRLAEHFKNNFPELGVVIDGYRVTFLNQIVYERVGAGVGIHDQDLRPRSRLGKNPVADIPCGRVVPFAHTGGKNQNSDGVIGRHVVGGFLQKKWGNQADGCGSSASDSTIPSWNRIFKIWPGETSDAFRRIWPLESNVSV